MSENVQTQIIVGVVLLTMGLWASWMFSGARDQDNVPGGLADVFSLFMACVGGLSLVIGTASWVMG